MNAFETVAPPPAVFRVLVCDDQPDVCEALRLLLKSQGWQAVTVDSPAALLDRARGEAFDLVLLDLNYARDTTSGAEGMDLLASLEAQGNAAPVMVMTAWSSFDLAVEAMRRGASDFVQKPWDNRQLLQKLRHQVSRATTLRLAQRQHDDELREAREIQDKLLPKSLPEVAGYELAGMTKPIRFVGGDYYNVVRVDPNHIALCIADVAGKGLPAALLMSSFQAALRPLMAQRLDPRDLCGRLNRILCELTPVGKFISFFYAVLSLSERRLTYCNAGHNPPLLIGADGRSSELNAAGAVLGQLPNWRYEQSDLQMSSGDKLVVFTDGLVEACNVDDEAFGEDNVVRIARENPASNAMDLMGLLTQAASRHCGGHFQDDASLIVLKATEPELT